jgi:hypothetical protein
MCLNVSYPFAGYRNDRGYVFADWSHPKGVSCSSLKFDEFTVPDSVPRYRESEWNGTFTPPVRTFFTVPEGYSIQASGGKTIAAAGLEVYSSPAVPGWANSILLTGMTMGRVYRTKLSADGRTAVGENEELFRAANRYRDLAVSPDGRTFYLATDNNGFGGTVDQADARVATFANPGSIVAFSYTAAR